MESHFLFRARHVGVLALGFAVACTAAPDEVDDLNPAPASSESTEEQTLLSVVEAALPVVDDERIRRHIEGAEAPDGSAIQFGELAGLVGLEEDSFTDAYRARSEAAEFSFEPERWRAVVTQELDTSAGMPLASQDAGAYLADFDAALDRLGVSLDERVVAAEPTFIMGQGFRAEADGPRAVSEPVVHGALLEARRIVDGIPVDGSRVKMLFRGPGEVILGDITWPAFVVHPSLDASTRFKTKQELSTEITSRLGPPSGEPPIVRAGVVYRPVEEEGKIFHVPALHVARVADGAAGEVFYVDLDASTSPPQSPAR